jgi:predicted Fe-S protein YdhL (DUF1289 family)
MKDAKLPHPLFGFLCAGCGRCLEELPAWQLGKERFHCSVFCRDADDAAEVALPADSRLKPRAA